MSEWKQELHLRKNNKQNKNNELKLFPSLKYSCDLSEGIMDLNINGAETVHLVFMDICEILQECQDHSK